VGRVLGPAPLIHVVHRIGSSRPIRSQLTSTRLSVDRDYGKKYGGKPGTSNPRSFVLSDAGRPDTESEAGFDNVQFAVGTPSDEEVIGTLPPYISTLVRL